MITTCKVTEIFCIIDEFSKKLHAELEKNMYLRLSDMDGRKRRKRECMMSESEIMTILVCCHFGTFAN
ncbi:IS982 family transposase, partial [Palleniella muris]